MYKWYLAVSFVHGIVRIFHGSDVIDDSDCPENSTSLSFCSFMTNDTGICAGHAFDAYLQCYNGKVI